MRKNDTTITPVEERFLTESSMKILYKPEEKIQTIVVNNFPALGKLAALRFIEWVQNNPGGVISLPTGKTPEHFIKWVTQILNGWNTKKIKEMLEENGINTTVKPDMKSLYFVQIDEFYPINTSQHNSFYYYVNKFYIDGFGLDRNKAILIDASKLGLDENETLESIWPDMTVDLSLRIRHATNDLEKKQKNVLAKIDQWCQEYEDKIRSLGGIGFFLGGIGPDGHIGFNVRGSDHYSPTRLTETNYETQAAAATDLGGIEIARKRLVITIGLGTITFNPKAAIIIIAAGEAKAQVVADALTKEKNILYPATSLQLMPNARFYITLGAAKNLKMRQLELFSRNEIISENLIEKVIVDCALEKRKRILELTAEDAANDIFVKYIIEKTGKSLNEIAESVYNRLVEKIEKGSTVRLNTTFLHTEPHHDDVMLGYLPAVVRHVRSATNKHWFATFTSGFTAVTNKFVMKQLQSLKKYIHSPYFTILHKEGYFKTTNMNGRNRDIWRYLDGVAANNQDFKEEAIARRLLRILMEVFDEQDIARIEKKIKELEEYFNTAYPGQKDYSHIQKLKGMLREWEVECLWGYFGWSCDNVISLRLGFYKGDIFTEEPTLDRDVTPTLELLQKINPDLVTMALDPEASGPDTHYKVLQAITEAIKLYSAEHPDKPLKIWGYRNVWYRFHPSEANLFVPVSLNMFAVMENSFLNTFNSQKEASFPSYEHDGPFNELAQKIQIEQYQTLKTVLGRDWFYNHPSPLIRATRGLVFLKEMTPVELFEHSRALKQSTENI